MPDGPDWGDQERGGESTVAALQQRQREAAQARLLAEGDQDHDHGDRNDADRGQAAVAAEVALARQLADGRSNCERNSEESERAETAAIITACPQVAAWCARLRGRYDGRHAKPRHNQLG